MKLELKHLAPYLPYGLKMIFEGQKGRILQVTGLRVAGVHEKLAGLIYFNSTAETLSVQSFKPILRPLSEIESYFEAVAFNDSKILEVLDVNYLDDFGNMSIQDIEHYNFINYPVSVYNLALEHHFDIFGLIQNNMAISIHDVEQVIA